MSKKQQRVWQAIPTSQSSMAETLQQLADKLEQDNLTAAEERTTVAVIPEAEAIVTLPETPERVIENVVQEPVTIVADKKEEPKMMPMPLQPIVQDPNLPPPVMQCGHPFQARGSDEAGMQICRWCADIERLKKANGRLQTELQEKSILVAKAVEESSASNRVIRQARVDTYQECLKVLAESPQSAQAVHVIRQKIQNEISRI